MLARVADAESESGGRGYGYGHYGPWQKATTVLPWTRGTMAMPPCCYCRRPARETEARLFVLTATDISEIPACGCPPPQFRCAPGKGCNAAPWSRAGAALRCDMQNGPPDFIRLRDGARMQVAE